MQEIKERQVRSLGREDPLEEGMAAHSSILTWRIPWTEDLAGYSPLGRRVGHTHIYSFTDLGPKVQN